MIARIWKGTTSAAVADEYMDYVRITGVKDLRATSGNVGVYVLRRTDGDVAEFHVISLWESREAILAFAGPDPVRAVYYPDDARYLLGQDPGVTHFDVLVSPGEGRSETPPAGER